MYSLGPALYRIGTVYINRKSIIDDSYPVLAAISNITHEIFSIGIREGDDAILAYKIEGSLSIRLEDRIGRLYPFNAGAIGKILAAYHSEERIAEILSKKELIKKTENTIVDIDDLMIEYSLIRNRGYAISDEENTKGSYGISAPIYDAYGNVSACLCLAGSKERFTNDKVESWIGLVVNSAREISFKLGYDAR